MTVPAKKTRRYDTKVSKRYVSKKMKAVIEEILSTGASVRDAAAKVGMSHGGARRALAQHHVKMYYTEQLRMMRETGAARAYAKINNLMSDAESERLQFDSARWVAGVEGVAPVKKVENYNQHRVTFGGFEYPTLKSFAEDTTVLEQDDDQAPD